MQNARQLPGVFTINYGAITRRIHQLRRNNQKQMLKYYQKFNFHSKN